MNNNITYDEAQIRRDVDTSKVVELLKKWRKEGESMRDLINHDDETTCPNCYGVGRVLKKGMLITDDEQKIYELSVKEYKKLWIECYEEMEQHKLDTSKKEYDKITTKRVVVDDVSTRGGVPVPKEY